ncbi:MAG: sulfatase-like hydrolase/transferase [Melioribacteraceae bacterium]|nr:sulfatase-like hydrolase/transferase [Melioribacteraceae bacterium]MCF8262903.1 sulfatase-like hydrolase/transferase [Melioribacteraceae bacterium]
MRSTSFNRRSFIKTTGLAAIGTAAYSSFGFIESPKTKPNLLFILTDQQRADTLAVYGNHKIRVPNLNKLANESVVFRKAYVSQPVCTPARSTIMTGLWPHTNSCTANNIPLKSDTKCLPELLNDGDYKTGYIGKWHLGDEVFPQHGFSEWETIEDGYSEYFSAGKPKDKLSAYHHWLIEKGYSPDEKEGTFSRKFVSKLPIEHSKTKFVELRGKLFLERNKDNPFMLFLGFFEPHSPFNGPNDNMYSAEDVELPKNFNDPLEENEPIRNQLLRDDFIENGAKGYSLKDENSWRQMISNYWGLISQVDASVGEVLNKLDELGLRKNTIVVFTSEHGDMMGSHKMALKTVMYEEAVRVPLMIRFPQKIKKQLIVENPVSQIDLAPTLLDFLNKKKHVELEGHSFAPFLLGGELVEDHVFIEWNPNTLRPLSKRLPKSDDNVAKIDREYLADQSIRTVVSPDGWKLCLSDRDKNQLFNLNEDPFEETNLFDDSHFEGIIKKLEVKIYEWQNKTNDTVSFN